MDFEWDDAKEVLNQRKHGLSFAEARRLFESGANYLEIFDAEHSETEDRFIAIASVDGSKPAKRRRLKPGQRTSPDGPCISAWPCSLPSLPVAFASSSART